MTEDAATAFKGSNCNTICCVRNLVVLYEGEEFGEYLEYHAANYQLLHNHIFITLQDASSVQQGTRSNLGEHHANAKNGEPTEGKALLEYINNIEGRWDGVVFPGHMVGALKDSSKLWDWNKFLLREQNTNNLFVRKNPTEIQWADIQPFYRSQAQQYDASTTASSPMTSVWKEPDDADRMTLYAPLDGDVLTLFYRKDLFAKHNIELPRTWDGYGAVAAFFHGKPWGPNNTPLLGSCVSRKRQRCNGGNANINAYWASLVLSTMTQTEGTKSGFLLNPDNLDPILGDAMEETLRILEEQQSFGDPNELTECDHVANNVTAMEDNLLLNEGNCAMTYEWANKFTTTMMNAAYNRSNIGIARTPGSSRVLNRKTGRLETCTPTLCPYGIYYDDIGIVNRPLYSAFGGWMGGVSNSAPSANQHAMADFFSYVSNPSQSFQDVLPNQRSRFMSPFRYSHLKVSGWNDAGVEEAAASQYTETVREVNSQNTVSEIRIQPGSEIRDILDEEVYRYLSAEKGIEIVSADLTNAGADATMRSITTNAIDMRIQEALSSFGKSDVLRSYQSSLGYSKSVIEGEYMNFIETQYRDAGWCTSIFICSMSIGIILWTIWNRNQRAMRAFQPFLIIQGAVGIFFMAATLIPLGFDDSILSKEALDISCVVMPWIYVFGFTVFFSSIYSSIRWCLKIFQFPGKYERITIRPMESFLIFCELFMLNAILLGLWTFFDPLKWQRREKWTDGPAYPTPIGTIQTYGSCRSDDLKYHWFGVGLFVLNLAACFIAMLQTVRCRLLVLDYRQMQWLQLQFLPVFEAWIAFGPILSILSERPTARYILLVVIIASSSIGSAVVVFAPKEWYVRKDNALAFDRKCKKNTLVYVIKPKPPRESSPDGIRVLKHPKVESLKHVLNLQLKLEHYKRANTELAIDIRILQEKFRLLTGKEKLDAVKGIFSKEITDFQNSRGPISAAEDEEWFGMSSLGPSGDFDILAMPAEDEEHENEKYNTAETEGSLEMLKEESQPQEGQMQVQETEIENDDIEVHEAGNENDDTIRRRNVILMDASVESTSSRSLNSNKSPSAVPNVMYDSIGFENSEMHPLVPQTPAERPSDDFVGKETARNETSKLQLEAQSPGVNLMDDSDTIETDCETKSNAIETGSSSSSKGIPEVWGDADNFDDKSSDGQPPSNKDEAQTSNGNEKRSITGGIRDDVGGLDEIIDKDDFEELESEATMLAEAFKLNSTFLESIYDLQPSTDGSGDLKSKEVQDRNVPTMNASPSSDTTRSISTSSYATDNGSKGSTMRFDAQPVSPKEDKTSSSGVEPVSAGESSGTSDVRVTERETENRDEGISREQNAGEPSSDCSNQIETNKSGIADKVGNVDADVSQDDGGGTAVLDPPIPTNASPQSSETNAEGGTTTSNQPSISSSSCPAPTRVPVALNSQSSVAKSGSSSSYSVGEWTARGRLGSLLADLSDSASSSSYSESITDSISSMDIAKSPSPLDIPVAKAIDKQTNNSDHDTVKVANGEHVGSAIDEEKGIETEKILTKRQKKRELEALRNSFRRSNS